MTPLRRKRRRRAVDELARVDAGLVHFGLGEMNEADLPRRYAVAALDRRFDIAPDLEQEGARRAHPRLGAAEVEPELVAFAEQAGASGLGARELGDLVQDAARRANRPAGMADGREADDAEAEELLQTLRLAPSGWGTPCRRG